MQIVFPKDVSAHKDFIKLLYKTESVFKLQGQQCPQFILDLEKIEYIDILGVLIVYKFMEYSIDKQCFSNPYIKYNQNSILKKCITEYGFDTLIYGFIKGETKTKTLYESLKFKTSSQNVIIAPHVLIRDNDTSRTSINTKYLPRIQEYYKNNNSKIQLILSCFSEVVLNFWEHATEDAKSIVVATGDECVINIVCADTGNGIISTMRGSTTKNSIYLLKNALKKGVTSKIGTAHMGFGLWLIDELCALNHGQLKLYSEGVCYVNNHGSKTYSECGFWKGTIICISLPLENVKTVKDIEESDNLSNIQINSK